MSDYLEVERVVEGHEGIEVGIIVYRKFQPPITVLFWKKWGEKIKYLGEENRADGFALLTSKCLSGEWQKYAEALAKTVIKQRLKKRKKEIFWASQPRLFY